MKKTLIDKENLTTLHWHYKNLLTPKQNNYFQFYFVEDWSLSEIADHFNISPSAVHDALMKIKRLLIKYESKLHLQGKQLQRDAIYYKHLDKCTDMIRALKIIDDQE